MFISAYLSHICKFHVMIIKNDYIKITSHFTDASKYTYNKTLLIIYGKHAIEIN